MNAGALFHRVRRGRKASFTVAAFATIRNRFCIWRCYVLSWRMKIRHSWIERIENAWQRRSLIWLPGVRRVGKTYLCQTLPEIEYFDCELPRVRRMMDAPQAFLDDLSGRRIVLDEVHRLGNPSELLKIAADNYPQTRVLATGSSTLGASSKFADTLAGQENRALAHAHDPGGLVGFREHQSPAQALTRRLAAFLPG